MMRFDKRQTITLAVAGVALVGGVGFGVMGQLSPTDEARRHIRTAQNLNSQELREYTRGDVGAARKLNSQENAELEAALSALATGTTTTTRPTTTTTTAPPTTTTEPPTTTTVAPTTTTLPPTTTTTGPSSTPTGEYYNISVNNLDDPDPATHQWWVAPYFRNLPFVSNTGWVDGDRVGYRCAYGFLEWEGRLVGRFTFTRLDAATYLQVNDKFMLEGIRYYDGTYDGPEAPRELGDCPAPSQEYLPSTVDERPTVDFVTNDGRILERRDGYKPIVHPDLTFEVIDGGPDHDIGVVAMGDGLPALVVYYDSLVDDVTIVSDIAP